MLHHFQFDPRAILGVGPEASAEQIHEAFREKSKKHHPDRGGDEWAFRIVARAYEVLKSTSGRLESGGAPSAPWAWTGAAVGPAETETESESEAPPPSSSQAVPPHEFRAVGVELIWIRLEMRSTDEPDVGEGGDRATLSVCMVVSWPVRSLVARTSEFEGAGETLRRVIEGFDRLDRGAALAVRTRIEDGQFVGWVSYPDVMAAQSAFLGFRNALAAVGLSVRLQTRDEMIPQSWLV